MRKTCKGCKAFRRNKESICLLGFYIDEKSEAPTEYCPKPLTDLDLANRLEQGHGNFAELFRKSNLCALN